MKYKSTIRDQKSQLMQLLREIERQNPSMIPALVHPEPLLDKDIPTVIVPGGPSQVSEILRYTWRYFASLPGARGILQDFLGTQNPFPKYNTNVGSCESSLGDTSGYDRAYMLSPQITHGLSGARPKEFKKGM